MIKIAKFFFFFVFAFAALVTAYGSYLIQETFVAMVYFIVAIGFVLLLLRKKKITDEYAPNY